MSRQTVQVRLKPQDRSGFLHTGFDFLGRKAVFTTGHAQAEREVLFHRHVRVKSVGLEHHAHTACAGWQVVHASTVNADGAGGDVLQAGEHAEGGGFSTSRRADEHEEFPLVHVDVQALHRRFIVGVVSLFNGFKSYVTHSHHPLTDPAVIPSTKYRWKTINSSTTGMLTRMEMAAKAPHWGD